MGHDLKSDFGIQNKMGVLKLAEIAWVEAKPYRKRVGAAGTNGKRFIGVEKFKC